MSTKPRRNAGTPRASATDGTPRARRIAVVGAGMAGITGSGWVQKPRLTTLP